MGISRITAKVVGDKRHWRQYKARIRQLPENYRIAVEGIERYLMHFGAVDADGDLQHLCEVRTQRSRFDIQSVEVCVKEDHVRSVLGGGHSRDERIIKVHQIVALARANHHCARMWK